MGVRRVGQVYALGEDAGGGTEAFFFELGELATDESSPPPASGPPDVETLREIARRHGSDIDTLALLQQLAWRQPPSEQDTWRQTPRIGG